MDPTPTDPVGIPPELVSFLGQPGGRSVIVKGGAGTGKTTLGLELLEKLGESGRSFYLSTRVSDEALLRQFPWLKTVESRNRIYDAGKIFLETIAERERDPSAPVSPAVRERLNQARDLLRTLGEEATRPRTVDRTQLNALLQRNRMPELEHLYDRIERVLPEKALLVVDSLEGVTHKYALEMEEMVMALQKDLAENSNTNVVMILEKPEAGGIEYLVDGLISLSREEVDERRIRHLRLEKLRATAIPRSRYAVTLAGGRFRALGLLPRPDPTEMAPHPWRPIPDSRTHFSTGIPDFDALLGGGFRRGSYNGFEIDVNVSTDDYYRLFAPMFLNFLSQDRGILGVLSGGESAESLKDLLARFIPPGTFDARVRITDYFAAEPKAPYILPMLRAGREDAQRALQNAERAVRGDQQPQPYIEYTGFDTLEYLQGDQLAIKTLFMGVERTNIMGDVGLGLLKPGLSSTAEIVNMMDTYFRVVSIDNTPCLYGVRPRTMLYALAVDPEAGAPHVRLIPLV